LTCGGRALASGAHHAAAGGAGGGEDLEGISAPRSSIRSLMRRGNRLAIALGGQTFRPLSVKTGTARSSSRRQLPNCCVAAKRKCHKFRSFLHKEISARAH